MKKIRLYGKDGQTWRYVNTTDKEAEQIAEAFLKGETFSIDINADSDAATYRSYFNSFQLVHLEIEDDDG